MNPNLFAALQVRFVKLRFTVFFPEDSVLPRDKVSAIRGGMGEMLLRLNCVRDRQCEVCDFETECIVQRTMYSRFEIMPYFVTSGGSAGYVLECENYAEDFEAGAKLDFYLILFGKTIVYFNQLYQALSMLGEKEGLGKYHAKFQITGIRNMEGMPVLDGKAVNMDRYVIHTLYDYIMFRKMHTGTPADKREVMMKFHTPLTLKYQGEFMNEFHAEALLNAIKRRVYMLDCFEGIESNILNQEQEDGTALPKIICQEYRMVSVDRYSTRKNEKMTFRGLKGFMLLGELTEEVLDLLLVGELIHIGKNTSFGFGRYHLALQGRDQ